MWKNKTYICTYIHICTYLFIDMCTHVCAHSHTHTHTHPSYLKEGKEHSPVAHSFHSLPAPWPLFSSSHILCFPHLRAPPLLFPLPIRLFSRFSPSGFFHPSRFNSRSPPQTLCPPLSPSLTWALPTLTGRYSSSRRLCLTHRKYVIYLLIHLIYRMSSPIRI